MNVSQFQHYEPSNTVNLISMYCAVYEVSITEIELFSVRAKVPGIKLQAIFQTIQHKYLEAATARPWTADEFIALHLTIKDWVEQSPESCDNVANWEYWWACQWKRAADRLLGLNVTRDYS